MEAAYLASTKEALDYFDVSEQVGLTDQEVEKAREQYGRNGILGYYPPSGASSVNMLLQLCQRIHRHRYGNLYLSNSKTSLSSYCLDRRPFLSFSLYSRTAKTGLHSSIR